MPETMEKVIYLRDKFPFLHIQVDGGISPDNAEMVVECGANWLVAGSAVFGAADRGKAIDAIKKGCAEGLKKRAISSKYQPK